MWYRRAGRVSRRSGRALEEQEVNKSQHALLPSPVVHTRFQVKNVSEKSRREVEENPGHYPTALRKTLAKMKVVTSGIEGAPLASPLPSSVSSATLSPPLLLLFNPSPAPDACYMCPDEVL